MNSKILCGPKFEAEIKPEDLGNVIFTRCGSFKERICQIDAVTGETETYASVNLRSTRLAIELQRRGVTTKDVISVCSPNTLDNTIPMIATFYVGARVANLEPTFSVRQTKHLLSLVHPKIIFVDQTSVVLIEQSLEGASFTSEIIVFGESQKYTSFDELTGAKEEETQFRPVEVHIDDVAFIAFSSGTTGLPKAICFSHSSLLPILTVGPINEIRVLLHFNSFYWTVAMYILFMAVANGDVRVFYRNPSARDIFRTLELWKVTDLIIIPFLISKLTIFDDSQNYNTSNLKTIYATGSPLPPLQVIKMIDLFPSAITLSLYGSTECGGISSFHPDDDKELIKRKASSCGKTVLGARVKFVDLQTKELVGPNQNGEIYALTNTMMKGYLNQDASRDFDEDGFYKTGDLGYYDEDGCIYVSGRVKEMFKYRNWHVLPSAIEAILVEHPSVKDAAVVGLPHDEDGEVPAACLVLEPNSSVTKDHIHQYLEAKLSDVEKLRGGITFVKEIPRNPTGKIIKRVVKDMILQ